ncbi:hypothetical protein NL676_024571 [Syzygium grande]|nr:hypothetical protein NL676_024571 [Syzygium grande]
MDARGLTGGSQFKHPLPKIRTYPETKPHPTAHHRDAMMTSIRPPNGRLNRSGHRHVAVARAPRLKRIIGSPSAPFPKLPSTFGSRSPRISPPTGNLPDGEDILVISTPYIIKTAFIGPHEKTKEKTEI